MVGFPFRCYWKLAHLLTLFFFFLDGELFFVDLEKDEDYFKGEGDYQYEIYRMMRKELGGKWELHSPKTNVFWIHYLVSKMIDGVRYKKRKGKALLQAFEDFRDKVLQFSNTSQVAEDPFFSDLIADEVVMNPLARLMMSS